MTLGEFFKGLAENRPLVSAVTAWAVAQVLKTIINYLINKEWKAERLWGSGGMPSSHSATVCAFLVATVFNYGPASFEFAMAVLFAIVVIHDARGVRLETGRQAEILNSITRFLRSGNSKIELPEEELKELVGHTPFQVAVGSAIGIIVGLLIH
jgi:acid phosphatase family membrane protein YuiD